MLIATVATWIKEFNIILASLACDVYDSAESTISLVDQESMYN